MSLVGCRVKHKMFGTGTIIEQDGTEYITVQFQSKTSTFPYPLAFEKFLQIVDEERREEIMTDLSAKKEAIDAEKSAIAAKWMVAARKIYGGGEYVDKKYVPVKRTEGTSLTFLVFQGGIFDIQSKEQYIWAPVYDAAGNHLFYWDNIMNIREGDIIFYKEYIEQLQVSVRNAGDEFIQSLRCSNIYVPDPKEVTDKYRKQAIDQGIDIEWINEYMPEL